MLFATCQAEAAGLPNEVARKIPPGFTLIAEAEGTLASPDRTFLFVALGRLGEASAHHGDAPASPRPLLLFISGPDGKLALAGRNDSVVFRRDEGGQCDPFLDGAEGLVVTGGSVTVQNGVACGAH